MTEEQILKHAKQHYSEIQAIEPEDITSEIRVKIIDNIHDNSSEQ